MAIVKPSWLQWWLDQWNYHITLPPWDIDLGLFKLADRGEWFDIRLNVGDWIEWAIDGILEPISAAIDAAIDLIPDFWDIWDYLKDVYNTIIDAVDFVQDWVLDKIQGVYSGMGWAIGNVYDFIADQANDVRRFAADAAFNVYKDLLVKIPEMIEDQVGNVLTEIRDSVNIVAEYRDEMVDLFSDPVDWLFRKFTAMVERFW